MSLRETGTSLATDPHHGGAKVRRFADAISLGESAPPVLLLLHSSAMSAVYSVIYIR